MPESITIAEMREWYTPQIKELVHTVNDLLSIAYQRGINGEPPLASLNDRIAKAYPDDAIVIELTAVVDDMTADAWEQGRNGEKPRLIFSV